MKTAFISALLIASAYGHTSITGVKVNGGSLQGCIRPQFPASEWQTGIGFQSPVVNLYDPAMDGLMSQNYSCGFAPYALAAAPSKCSVAAGSTIQVQFYHGAGNPGEGQQDMWIASSHKGPIMMYMARWESATGVPTTPIWFKVFHADILARGTYDGTTNTWAAAGLLNQNAGLVTVTIPSDIQAGNYLLRTELIAYHDNRPRGRQPYVNCAELTVTGGGSANPGSYAFPGAYDWSDAGLNYNIYAAKASDNYPIPGNIPVYQAGSAPNPNPSPVTPTPQTPPTPVPTPVPAGGNTLTSYATLGNNQRLCDPTGAFCAVMQGDANLVIYKISDYSLVWASGSWQASGTFQLTCQGDGNLVIYDISGGSGNYKAVWTSGTWGKGVTPYTLVMQSDSNLCYYDSTGALIWTTGIALADVGIPPSTDNSNNVTVTGVTQRPNISLSPDNDPFGGLSSVNGSDNVCASFILVIISVIFALYL